MQTFPRTTVDLDVPCESTTTGSCTPAPSLDECMRQCVAPTCYWGTYSTTDQSCKPVYYNAYRDLNPGFILKPDAATTTFADGAFFTLPAQRGDRVFFYDRVRVQNVETGQILKPDVRLRMTRPFLPPPAIHFIPVTRKTPVLLYDRQLDSVLRVEGRNVNWYKSVDFLNQDYEAFFLEPTPRPGTTSATPPDDSVYYSDTFRMRTAANEYISLPPLYQHFTPRLNDLVTMSNTLNLPRTFRFVYVPTNPSGAAST